jgi:hypothetical protein
MARVAITPAPTAKILAEHELVAFLLATRKLAGNGGLVRAVEAWLHAMNCLDWPAEDHEKFFRRVSILAISELVSDSKTGSGDENPGPGQIPDWLSSILNRRTAGTEISRTL